MKNCGTTVQNALLNEIGVSKAVVNFPLKKAYVWGSGLSVENLIAAVESVGFDATKSVEEEEKNADDFFSDTIKLTIDGMMCQKNCGTTVQVCHHYYIIINNTTRPYFYSLYCLYRMPCLE